MLLLMVMSSDLNPYTLNVPVHFTNSTSLIQTVAPSKHHKSLQDDHPDWTDFFTTSLLFHLLILTPSLLSLCRLVPLQSLSHFLRVFTCFFGRSVKFVVCSLNSALMDWLSSASLKISPRANPLPFPRCHAEDE